MKVLPLCRTIRNLLPVAIALIVLFSMAPGQPKADAAISKYAFTGITVIDVETGRAIGGQVVVVEDGRIKTVGPAKTTIIPREAQQIDGRNRFLAPGFADMHVHLYTEGDAFTYLANGITTVRNMAGDPSHLAMKQRVTSGEILGPRIITAGPVIETELSHPDNALVTSIAEAKLEVKRQREAGYDFIKVYNDITPEIYDAVLVTAHELGMPVAGHVPYAVGIRGAIKGRQDSIEHLRGYLHELLPSSKPLADRPGFRDFTLAWNNANSAKMQKLAEETVKAGIWNCATFAFAVHEMSPEKDHRRLTARRETGWLSLKGMPSDRTKGYLAGFTDSDFAAAQKGLTNQFKMLRALARAGAGLMIGTDSWLSGYAFADELELLSKSGLGPARILKMATIDAATFLGEGKDRGSIRTGKVADLVMLEANPLVDVAAVRKVAGVMRSGRYYDRTVIDQMIESLRSSKAGAR